jgi:DNA-binding NarL/FixJ family response regulator
MGELMEQAVQAYRSVLTSEDFVELERMREKAYYDEIAALDYATKKGIAEERREIVLNMHEAGLSVADIVRVSKISEKEVKKILES